MSAATTPNVKAIHARQERWELAHLRALAASLYSQLESAQCRANDAESWAKNWIEHAALLQKELLQVAEQSSATPKPQATDSAATTPPAPGQYWPAQGGTYIGIAPAEGNLPARHLIALDARPDEELNWHEAVKWAEAQGNGARLPTQLEAMFAFTTAKAAFKPHYYWTLTQLSANVAFVQDFEFGRSLWVFKDYQRLVCPFRGLDLHTFNALPSSV